MKNYRSAFLFVMASMLLTLMSACHGKTSLTTIEEEQSQYSVQEYVKELVPVSAKPQTNGDMLLSFQLTEDVVSVKELQAAKDDVKYALLEKIHTSTDTTLQSMVKYCKTHNSKMIYHYEGEKTNDVFDIQFANSEMND